VCVRGSFDYLKGDHFSVERLELPIQSQRSYGPLQLQLKPQARRRFCPAEELIGLLEKHGITYDKRYIWE
jgi:hypothetical protein